MCQLWLNLRLFLQGAILSYIALFRWFEFQTKRRGTLEAM
jgi:hypothetical protein